MAQCGACKHNLWQGYMHPCRQQGIIQSIIILTVVIDLMIKFDVDELWDWFRQEVMQTLIIDNHSSTLCVLDLDHVHHHLDALRQGEDTYCMTEGNE
jgi:hypothetical protein